MDRRHAEHLEKLREKLNAEESERDRQWWAEFDRYLSSPKWRAKRAKVLARCGGVCESCLEERATEVHHLTYSHVFDEPAFDLRAVCAPCHQRLTKRDRENRSQYDLRRRA